MGQGRRRYTVLGAAAGMLLGPMGTGGAVEAGVPAGHAPAGVDGGARSASATPIYQAVRGATSAGAPTMDVVTYPGRRLVARRMVYRGLETVAQREMASLAGSLNRAAGRAQAGAAAYSARRRHDAEGERIEIVAWPGGEVVERWPVQEARRAFQLEDAMDYAEVLNREQARRGQA